MEIRTYDYIVQFEKVFTALESKKLRLTDMLIDGTISKKVYETLRDWKRSGYLCQSVRNIKIC